MLSSSGWPGRSTPDARSSSQTWSAARDPEDRRRNVVTLTNRGKATLARLDEQVDAAQRALLEPLSAKQRREVVALLERVVSHQAEERSELG
jgi:DNA-binding PadR family transcriptional regulator